MKYHNPYLTCYFCLVARASHASYAQVAFHLSELILLEMECSTEKPFAQFDSLSDYLMSSDPLVVEVRAILYITSLLSNIMYGILTE